MFCRQYLVVINPFPNRSTFCHLCSLKSFETIDGKGEIAQNVQLLLLPQCFYTISILICQLQFNLGQSQNGRTGKKLINKYSITRIGELFPLCSSNTLHFKFSASVIFSLFEILYSLVQSICRSQNECGLGLWKGRRNVGCFEHFLLHPQCFQKHTTTRS